MRYYQNEIRRGQSVQRFNADTNKSVCSADSVHIGSVTAGDHNQKTDAGSLFSCDRAKQFKNIKPYEAGRFNAFRQEAVNTADHGKADHGQAGKQQDHRSRQSFNDRPARQDSDDQGKPRQKYCHDYSPKVSNSLFNLSREDWIKAFLSATHCSLRWFSAVCSLSMRSSSAG